MENKSINIRTNVPLRHFRPAADNLQSHKEGHHQTLSNFRESLRAAPPPRALSLSAPHASSRIHHPVSIRLRSLDYVPRIFI